ncbi:hypothetical protein [Sporosarcina sp. Te-1]|uniref:hypothetical protein n=1 Tax=Sporosarcina sp. Te-1 TaxID=2818390 RepID=UPI001A9F08A8|nr:hypothetical protein [Sporosarcina sp. Te-1]QTD43075.1 hypothetical protein J3U78_10200 [Sporosarcina sp. Te-1]
MNKKIAILFTDIQDDTEAVLAMIEPMDHPLLILLQASLHKQLVALKTINGASDAASLDDLKEDYTIVFHSNEVTNPFFESWKRTTDWLEWQSKGIAEQIEPLIRSIKKNLETAGAELENLYGHEAIKFVVPSFYLPATTREG